VPSFEERSLGTQSRREGSQNVGKCLFDNMKMFFQVMIVPRIGEEKGAVQFRPDHSNVELQSVRYAPS
jgi:hypothetical protein